MMARLEWKIHPWVLGLFVVLATLHLVWGLTDPRDVYVMYQLQASLGFPQLSGWILGGDPCGPPSWQGLECVSANVTAIKLNGANLGGELTEALGLFASIVLVDLSNNQIGGSIPSSLPITLKRLYLNNNQLTGSIPDAFQMLKDMTDLDLSGNSLTDELPSSMGNLSSLTTMHLQNNQLSGVLDVLQDLPLTDLNIENNMFSGPIPKKLLSIPNIRRAGNLFNSTTSPPTSSPLSPGQAPSSQLAPGVHIHGPSASTLPQHARVEKKNTIKKITWIAIGGLFVVVVLLLGSLFSMSRRCRGSGFTEKTMKRHEIGTNGALPETHKQEQSSLNPLYQVKKASKKVGLLPAVGGSRMNNACLKQEKDQSLDMKGLADTDPPPGSLPFPLLPAERIIADPTFTPLTSMGNVSKIKESAKFFTIASLQQYTNSFSQENLIGKGVLGAVYKAQLPDGKVLAVKKLDNGAGHMSNQEFRELVSRVSHLRHKNIVELLGYCLEHGQHLLIYNYYRNGTLDEALNWNDEIKKRLSWKARMHLALQAAKSLEYLHEVCQPPIVHQNFKSCNVLLEDDLAVRVSDCGLAPLLSPSSMAQLQGSGDGAPELELGSYSCQSDVYSFGIVMLQLLTGRKSYDRSRPQGEQYLAKWAFSRLHDIDALSEMVDPSLNGAYPSMSLSWVADIISLCIQPAPEFRPPMSEIVQKLLHMIQRDP